MCSPTYCSFMLRMARTAQPGKDERWHSEVQHIQSGRHYHFDSIDDLLAFLRCMTESPQTPPAAEARGDLT